MGHNLGLHADYDESIRAIAAAIDRAEKYVSIEIYIQSWDEVTDVFFESLRRATARGVKVRLLLDQIGSFKYKGYFKLGKQLTEIGVDWHLMLPIQIHKGRFRRPDLRNHRKLVIIDGKVGFIGSLNMIKRQYKTKDRYWIDYMVELSGPIVTSMSAVFAVDWYLEAGENFRSMSCPMTTPRLPTPTTCKSSPPGRVIPLSQTCACSTPWCTTPRTG